MLLIIAACSKPSPHFEILVAADSLIAAGEKDDGQRLLETFDSLTGSHADSRERYYRLLLSLEQEYVAGSIETKDFTLADSLCRYYHGRKLPAQYAKSLLFRGFIFQQVDDHPAAIRDYLQAENISSRCNNLTLKHWICSSIGDLYFKERSFEDCMPYYRRCYELATLASDTLRISYAALRMGRLFTIVNDADSACYYYQKAMDMGRRSSVSTDIVPVAQSLLCDIYIQTGQFAKAAAILPHDELNDENWAYWHYGQQHTDSAIFYFRQMLGKYGPYADAQSLLRLAQLSEQQGDDRQALYYYRQYAASEDSLKAYSQSEETRLAHAQFNVNSIVKERDAAINKSRQTSRVLYILLAAILAATVIGCLELRYRRKAKEEETAHWRLLLKEEEEQRKKSAAQLAANKEKMTELNIQLAKAQSKGDDGEVRQIENCSEVLQTENMHIQALQRQLSVLEEEFRCSPLYLHILHNVDNSDFKLSDDEWALIAERMDTIYNHFTSRLLHLAKLHEEELRTCYLVKMGLETSAVANILHKSYNAVYMSRKRLYKKITRKEGTAQDFDAFIRSF